MKKLLLIATIVFTVMTVNAQEWMNDINKKIQISLTLKMHLIIIGKVRQLKKVKDINRLSDGNGIGNKELVLTVISQSKIFFGVN